MDMDIYEVREIIKENRRFSNPFCEPFSYYIWNERMDESIDEKTIELYWEKLEYAVRNAERLIQQAFQPTFYEFDGVNRKILFSPEEMCQQLIFDSFVLNPKENRISACLSNSWFMSGHYIECCWDYEWKLIYSCIC